MNTNFIILPIIISRLFCSCSTTTRYVTIVELEQQLQGDTQKLSDDKVPFYQWSYVGSTNERHYFRRQVGRIFYSEARDGIYGIPRRSLSLGENEFSRPNPDDSSKWKEAFTERADNYRPVEYSTRFGVEGS